MMIPLLEMIDLSRRILGLTELCTQFFDWLRSLHYKCVCEL